jgi:NAD(P)-dependent dehydrogenase (short-subunit alcohol dehydrogenase family)
MSKVWLVTGSASGLGRDIVEAVLASGSCVPQLLRVSSLTMDRPPSIVEARMAVRTVNAISLDWLSKDSLLNRPDQRIIPWIVVN